MKTNFSSKKLLTKNKIIILLVVLVVLVLLTYRIGYDIFFLEEFCYKQADQIVGKHWTKKIPATDFDRQHWAGIIQEDGKIFAGMHEVLNCEDAHKAFVIF
ncbi:MAG: hypothetical protein E6I80_17570 [Chloroflexi bacterium]|nr:MAG: hypothetical protein E6I80_17570 [Chloroflexota bacterium]